MSKMIKVLMASAVVLTAAALPASAAKTTGYSQANPGGYGLSQVSEGTLVSQASYFRVCLNSGHLNVRSAAGTGYRTVGRLYNGQGVRFFDSAQGNDGYMWYLVGRGNMSGWVRSSYLCGY